MGGGSTTMDHFIRSSRSRWSFRHHDIHSRYTGCRYIKDLRGAVEISKEEEEKGSRRRRSKAAGTGAAAVQYISKVSD